MIVWAMRAQRFQCVVLIGAEFLVGALPLSNRIVLVSGRTSFEVVQKAAEAGVRILAAVGAPSTLAVQLAENVA